jgi:hypothetical protein
LPPRALDVEQYSGKKMLSGLQFLCLGAFRIDFHQPSQRVPLFVQKSAQGVAG